MNLTKREFLQVLGAGTMAGMGLSACAQLDTATASEGLYDIPSFGKVSFLHMTDCHAQLKPIYFREPNINLGLGSMNGNLPHLVGEHLLKVAKVRAGTAEAHALKYLDDEQAAKRYGKGGGDAHL
nr:thiosulfohydrolase SoxB [Rhodoferax sp.]